MYKLLYSLLTILLIISFNSTFAKNFDEKNIMRSYYQWCNAIAKAKGNSKVIVKYYAYDAVLLPTLSSKILFNKNGGLNAYFSNLTSHKNIHCVTEKLMTRIKDKNFAMSEGFYQFVYTNAEGKKIIIPARFTFVYEKLNNQWLIIQHHSSVIPQ